MYFSSIEYGDRVEIKNIKLEKYTASEGNLSDDTYISEVYEIYDDRTMEIMMPISAGRLIPLSINKKYYVTFIAKKGIFTAIGTVVNRYKKESFYLLKIAIDGEVKKVQRREFFRLETSLDFEFIQIENNIERKIKNLMYLEEEMIEHGVTIDISGGGMKFLSSYEIGIGKDIFVKLDISDIQKDEEKNNSKHHSIKKIKKDINVFAVLSLIGCFLNESGYYECRGNFCDIDNKDREKLIKYLFLLDRRLRKKDKNEWEKKYY